MAETLISTKPYMIRAIHEWCEDNGLTPHLLVVVDGKTRVPRAFVKDGEIVLNLNHSATSDLHMDNEAVVFSARFGGVSHHMYIPVNAVRGIYARENGQGMFFELGAQDAAPATEAVNAGDDESAAGKSENKAGKKRPNLTIVK